MIIPIGHDKGVRRLPFVTGAIILVCLALQIHRSFNGPSVEELSAKDDERVAIMEQIANDLYRRGRTLDPRPMIEGDYRGIEHPLVAELERVDQELKAIAGRDLAVRLGWAPDDGVTINLILSAFVHAGWLHLVGNMLFLWLAGLAIEDRWGHAAFALFYVVAAAAAAAAYGLWHPGTDVPVVGASGAVAGCMGAFLVAYARVNIRFWYFWSFGWRFHSGTFDARALVALPVWFAEEALYSYFEAHGGGAGVAHSAHVGGFVVGVLVATALRYSAVETRYLMHEDEVDDERPGLNPELEQGLAFERAGNKSAALSCYRQVLARDPSDPTARAHALECAIELRHREAVPSLVEASVRDMLREGRQDDVPALYERLHDADLAAGLSDRTLVDIARVCLASPERAPIGVHVVRCMLDAPEHSPLLPGLLWQVAEVQAGSGRRDLALNTLGMLVDLFPLDPFADHARARAAELQAVAASA